MSWAMVHQLAVLQGEAATDENLGCCYWQETLLSDLDSMMCRQQHVI